MSCASYCGLEVWLKNSVAIQQNNKTMLVQPLHQQLHIPHNAQNPLSVGLAAYEFFLLPLILFEVADLVILACSRKTKKGFDTMVTATKVLPHMRQQQLELVFGVGMIFRLSVMI